MPAQADGSVCWAHRLFYWYLLVSLCVRVWAPPYDNVQNFKCNQWVKLGLFVFDVLPTAKVIWGPGFGF